MCIIPAVRLCSFSSGNLMFRTSPREEKFSARPVVAHQLDISCHGRVAGSGTTAKSRDRTDAMIAKSRPKFSLRKVCRSSPECQSPLAVGRYLRGFAIPKPLHSGSLLALLRVSLQQSVNHSAQHLQRFVGFLRARCECSFNSPCFGTLNQTRRVDDLNSCQHHRN
jgi:hypothetical protein